MLHTIWLPEISSGICAFDKLHQNFFGALEKASTTEDRDFCAEYLTFTKKAEDLFRQEDQWMEEINFAGIKSHQEQHARVLSALHGTFSRVMTNDFFRGRRVVEVLLPQWYSFHVVTLDAALAFALHLAEAEGIRSDLQNDFYATEQ